jgi:branched-chain amino acid transport system permease protein
MLGLSVDLLMGYTGLVSFGHSAFFGLSAYVVALSLRYISQSTWLAMGLGIAAAALFAVPMGYFSIRRSGIYFAMLTLAFSQILYVAANQDFLGLTGGSDGIVGITSGNIGIPSVINVVPGGIAFYYITLGLLLVTFVTLSRIVNSPFGSVLKAIRENEDRARAAGYDVQRYKLKAFIVSGLFGGVAGAVYSPYYSAAAPEILFWELSGQGVVIVLLGGMGTLVGPMIGGGLFVVIRELVKPYLADWTIVLGIVFIVFILYLPNGTISMVDIAREKIRERLK